MQRVEQKARSTPQAETNKDLLISSKYAGLGAAMAAALMIGFWLGIVVILAVKMVQSLEYLLKNL